MYLYFLYFDSFELYIIKKFSLLRHRHSSYIKVDEIYHETQRLDFKQFKRFEKFKKSGKAETFWKIKKKNKKIFGNFEISILFKNLKIWINLKISKNCKSFKI